MKVFVVEYVDKDSDENVIAHIASTCEKAVSYALKNSDYGNDPDHFHITMEEVDNENVVIGNHFVGKVYHDGHVILTEWYEGNCK